MNYDQKDLLSRTTLSNIPMAKKIVDPTLVKSTMTVPEMRKLLGIKKTESYWLVHKNYFKTETIAGQMRIDLASFEKWYANQVKHRKVTGEEPGLEVKSKSYSARDMAEILGITESVAYDIWQREQLPVITVDYWKRLPVEEFDRWYQSQNKYRTKEDRERDQFLEDNSVSMPEMARLLGIAREEVYKILGSKKYQNIFKTIVIADRRRVMRDSLDLFVQCQDRYKYKEDIEERVLPKNFDVEAAARFAGVSCSTILRKIQSGELPSVRIGKHVRITISDLQDWMKAYTRKETVNGVN